MSDGFDRAELIQLIDRHTAGTISADEHQRLEEILTKHPRARTVYFAWLDMDLGLREIAIGRSAEIPPPVGVGFELPAAGGNGASNSGVFRWGYAIAATAVGLVAVAMLMVVWQPDRPAVQVGPQAPHAVVPAGPPVVEDVATLLFADECRWEIADAAPVEGQRLPVGALRLVDGLALLRFDGGAVVVLSGDVQMELESRGSVRLRRGRLTVRAPDEAAGFTVRTPASDVVDLGTEFAVEVGPEGATELHVLDGAVEYRKPDEHPGLGQLLRSGEAVRFDNFAGSEPRRVAVDAKRVEDLLREAKPRPREDLLMVYEGFQYEVGAMPVDAADGGWGWKGPWRLRSPAERSSREPDTTTDMLIAFQKLNVPWPIRGGRAGMLELPPGDNFRVRPLAQPIDLGTDSVHYVSMLIREQADESLTEAEVRRESVRLTFRSSQDFWGDRICFGLPGKRQPHIELADFIRFTGTPVSEGQSLLWVAKIASRNRGEDKIFFRVYQEGESLDIVEPADWSIVSEGVRSDTRLDLLMLSSTGQLRRWFDEVRIGTSWRAVIPIAQRTKIEPGETILQGAADDEL
ncbi:MAG: FecR family protein [Planctomycetota bacterium]